MGVLWGEPASNHPERPSAAADLLLFGTGEFIGLVEKRMRRDWAQYEIERAEKEAARDAERDEESWLE